MKRKRSAKSAQKPLSRPKPIERARRESAPPKRPRLKRSAVAGLFERGLLEGAELRAAAEIERIYIGLTRGLFARAANYEGGGGRRVDLAEALAIAHRDRYKPWADQLSASRKRGGPPIFEIAIDCLVEGRSLHELDRLWRWRHGKAADYLCEALTLYARLAGWRTEPGSDGVRRDVIPTLAQGASVPLTTA